MKYSICVNNTASSKNSRIHETFVHSTIYETKDASLESAKKVLEKMYGKRYCKKLEYSGKHGVFNYYTFRNNHIDWEYSTVSIKFLGVKKVK